MVVFTGSNQHGADELHPVTDQEDKGNKKLHIILHRDLYFQYKKLEKAERKRKPSFTFETHTQVLIDQVHRTLNKHFVIVGSAIRNIVSSSSMDVVPSQLHRQSLAVPHSNSSRSISIV